MSRKRSAPRTFEQTIAEAEKRFLEQASKLGPPGPELDELQQKLAQLETAAHFNTVLPMRPAKGPRLS